MKSERRERRPSPSGIFVLHYCKLFYRSLLFLAALVIYVVNRIRNTGEIFGGFEDNHGILSVIWLVFAVEMLLRFFPSSLESMGCQKQFARNYKPTGTDIEHVVIQSRKSTLSVAAVWFALNGAIGVLYFTKIIDAGILLLIALAYSVCDMICILFFCPFQTWFMKNRCCTTCRIYNWDFAMMFTPLIFVRSWYAGTLVGLSLLLLLQWELRLHRYPERFSVRTNQCLNCANCEEKLCHHKKQLQRFLKKNVRTMQLNGNELFRDITGRKKR